MTSILRSYYTWQTVETLDTSWDLLPMGLWTWAELSIGIIVGCLPALPKFFQHVGPKIYRSLSGTGPGRGSSAAPNAPKLNVLAKVKRPFAKYEVGLSVSDSWNDASNSRAHDEYFILGEVDASLPQATTLSTPILCPGQDIATARDDLEYGECKA